MNVILSEKKPDSKEHVLYNFTRVKFKSRQNQPKGLEVRGVVPLGRRIVARMRGHTVFWGDC